MLVQEKTSAKLVGIVLIFVAALTVRLLVVGAWYGAGRGDHLSSDTTSYYEIAQNIIQGQGFVQAGSPFRRTPVFPLLLATALKFHLSFLWVQIFQAIMGAATSVILWMLGREMFGEPAGLIAAGIHSIDYLSVRQTVAIMPEITLVFLLLLGTWIMARGIRENRPSKMALGGILAGLTVLTKEVFMLYFLGTCFLVLFTRHPWRRKFLLAVSFLILFLMTLSPWLVRNHQISGKWFLITANGGHVFYLGNNSTTDSRMVGEEWDYNFDSHYPVGDPNLPQLFTVEADRYLLQLGLEYLRKDPVRFLEQAGKKLVRFWFPFYTDVPLLTQWLTFFSYAPVFVLGFFGMIGLIGRWREFFLLMAPIFYLTLIHTVTISSIRYRYPVMPFLMLFAAFAIHELWTKFTLGKFKP